MNDYEIKQMINEEILANPGLMLFNSKDIDKLYEKSDVIDGIKVDGKIDDLSKLVFCAFNQIKATNSEQRLETIYLHLRVATGSDLLMEQLSPLYDIIEHLCGDIHVKLNIEENTTLPDEIRVCVLGGFKEKDDIIDYTPHQCYEEIIDRIPSKKQVIKGRIVGYSLMVIYMGIVVLLFSKVLQWTSFFDFFGRLAIVAFLAIVIGAILGVIYLFNSPRRPRLRAYYANVIKDVIGFDFGDNYKLLHASNHGYDEYLYIFSEESFGPLKQYLESMNDGKQEGTGYVVTHCYNGKEGAGFTLVENRTHNYCGNIEKIEVDYKGRTLKHTWTIY